jgi:putative ABC transport system ATP-binding protein
MIQLTALKKYYQMGETTIRALDGIDLHIGRNEFVAVMGASGSGKSTLMNILGCLDKPTEGSYCLNGKEVSRLNDDELSFTRNKHLGFVFQNFNLLPRYSALKNTYLPLKYSPGRTEAGMDKAARMLELAGLAGRLHHRLARRLDDHHRSAVVLRLRRHRPGFRDLSGAEGLKAGSDRGAEARLRRPRRPGRINVTNNVQRISPARSRKI